MTGPVERMKHFLYWLSGVPADDRDAQPVPPDAPEAAPEPETTAATREVSLVPEDVINDATAYGVRIEPAQLPEGTAYWQAIRVHHLTPDENHGNHHIYLDALDEAGERIYGAQIQVRWDGGEQILTIEKPIDEPGTNIPMWKWQVCAVKMLDDPSDRVVNLHTAHPDEPPGNTLFHHSFHVDFQRAVMAPPPPPQDSVISGNVENGSGRTLVLSLDGEPVDRIVLGEAGTFSFSGLAAGTYLLAIDGSEVESEPIVLDGSNSTTVDLSVPADEEPPASPGKPLTRYVLFGSPQSSNTAVFLTLANDFLVRRRPSFGYRAADAALAAQVLLVGGPDDLPPDIEATLVAAGCQVGRIQGTPQEVAATFQVLLDENGFLPGTSG